MDEQTIAQRRARPPHDLRYGFGAGPSSGRMVERLVDKLMRKSPHLTTEEQARLWAASRHGLHRLLVVS